MIDVAQCEDFRRRIKAIVEELGATERREDIPESTANVILAYRHLEDASMRLGKAIQALDGGVSVYDQTQVPKVGDAGHPH